MNLDQLSQLGEQEINPQGLLERGVIRKLRSGLKVLGDGELKKPLKIQAHGFSEQAKKKIEAAGGQAVLIHA